MLILASAVTSAAEPRFSGTAGLSADTEAGIGNSADGRFNLQAALRPEPSEQSSGRFGLTAKLQPDAKSVATACGPVVSQIFQNGFE